MVIPVLASPAAAALLGRPGGAAQLTPRQPDLRPIRVRVAGELRATPAQPGGGACLGTVTMGLALGAAGRRRTLARMTTVGLDHPTGLVVTEAMPAVLAAIVAGLACALRCPSWSGRP
jgi:hypothetical protein